MKTYKVIENWEVFKSFISEKLDGFNKNAVCFMHTDDEILIRVTDRRILNAVQKKYELTECKMPNLRDNQEFEKWSSFFGNESLFLKL